MSTPNRVASGDNARGQPAWSGAATAWPRLTDVTYDGGCAGEFTELHHDDIGNLIAMDDAARSTD